MMSEECKLTGPHLMDNLLRAKCPVDTVICCKDGRIGAHRLILTAASPFLGLLFREQKLGEVAVLVLPEIRRKIMETLLHLAYTGKMIYPPEDEEEILSAIECLCFACAADLELTMVTVVKREPLPPTLPHLSDPDVLKYSLTQDRRKREAEESAEKGTGPAKKKLRFGNGKIHTSKRTGTPIGKLGLAKLRKRQWRQIVANPTTQSKLQYLVSNVATNTISINPRKLPTVSIQLTKITSRAFLEVPVGRKRWFNSEEEREQYYRISREAEAEDASSSGSDSDNRTSSLNDGIKIPMSPNVGCDNESMMSSLDNDNETPRSDSPDALDEWSSLMTEHTEENYLFPTPICEQHTQPLEATVALQFMAEQAEENDPFPTPLSQQDTQKLEATVALQSHTHDSTECEVAAP